MAGLNIATASVRACVRGYVRGCMAAWVAGGWVGACNSLKISAWKESSFTAVPDDEESWMSHLPVCVCVCVCVCVKEVGSSTAAPEREGRRGVRPADVSKYILACKRETDGWIL